MAIIRGREGFKSLAKDKVRFIRIAKIDVLSSLCLCTRTRGHRLETSIKAMHFWKSGFKFAFGRNKKKGNVFGILSQLRKLSKSNDVRA